MVRDWNEELRKTQERTGNYFKPESNTPYRIRFLDEGGAEYVTTYEDREIVRVDFKVEVSGGAHKTEQMTWTLNIAGAESLWGMLNTVFAETCQSTGVIVNIVAVGDGRKRRYTVKEYNNLMFQAQAEEDGVDQKVL